MSKIIMIPADDNDADLILTGLRNMREGLASSISMRMKVDDMTKLHHKTDALDDLIERIEDTINGRVAIANL